MKAINIFEEELLSRPNFREETGITSNLYLINNDWTLSLVDSINNFNKKIAKNYIYVCYYECITKETMNGNRYIKPNYEIKVLSPSGKNGNIENNGWIVNDFITYGTCEFGYSEKLHIQFTLTDIFGDKSNLFKFAARSYDIPKKSTFFIDKLKLVLEKIRDITSYRDLKVYELSLKVKELEKQLTNLKA